MTNTHTYTEIVKTEKTVNLPPGRFLDVGEIVEENDLYCGRKAPEKSTLIGHEVKDHWFGKHYRPEPQEKLDPGTGYELLPDGEGIKSGDEWWDTDKLKWMPTLCEGYKVRIGGATTYQYRRKVVEPTNKECGVGYRLLKENEPIEKGDEYKPYYAEETWVPVSLGSIGQGLWNINVGRYRRPVQKRETIAPVVTPMPTPVKKVRGPRKYRLLKDNETIQKGDQAYDRTTRGWGKAKMSIGSTPEIWRNTQYNITRFRRKVS